MKKMIQSILLGIVFLPFIEAVAPVTSWKILHLVCPITSTVNSAFDDYYRYSCFGAKDFSGEYGPYSTIYHYAEYTVLLVTAVFMLIGLVILSNKIIKRLEAKNFVHASFWIIFLVVVVTISFYLLKGLR